MYIPSFKLSKIMFIISTIIDMSVIYAHYEYTIINKIVITCLTILHILLTIPIGIICFWYFNRNLVRLSLLGCAYGIIYILAAFLFVCINPLNSLANPKLLVMFFLWVVDIILKFILACNIYVLKLFLVVDMDIYSDTNQLQGGNFSQYTQNAGKLMETV